MRAITSFLFVSPLLALFAVASPSPFIDLQPRTYDRNTGCGKNEFFWDNDCCPKGGPSKKPTPPQGLDCPGSWYWGSNKGKCYPTAPNPPTPTCGKDWSWDGSRKCCKKNPPPPKPTPTPPPPKPSSWVHGGKKKDDKDGWNNGGWNGGWNGKWWKRGLDWDNSFCPSGLATCPISVNGRLTSDTECVDIKTDLYSCGGCASLGEGTDCSKIPNATSASCQAGTCVVDSCGAGFRPSADDSSCIRL